MDKISSYNIGVSVESLRNGFKLGMVPEGLHEPFQSLLPRLTRAASESPTEVYLFSSDDIAEIRDFFGYSLAAALMQHVPSTLLVDCGFTTVGLSGIIPERDALGFLDLLLYGSSLGVITQETSGGVHVVGAGSFPVTKKMPFVLNSFEEASRRLVSHSRCAIYCGPLYDDNGELHPLVGVVDVPIMVRVTKSGAGVEDPIEEQVSAQCDSELLSVRISLRDAPVETATPESSDDEYFAEPEVVPPPAPEPKFEEISRATSTTQQLDSQSLPPVTAPPARTEPPPSPEPPRAPAPPPPSTAGVEPPKSEAPEVEFEEESGRSSRGGRKNASLAPKIATIAVALVVVAFLVWWFNAERRTGGESDPGQVVATQTENPDTDPVAGGGEGAGMPVDTAAGGVAADTSSARGAAQSTETHTTPAPTLTEDPPVRPPPTGTETDPTGQTGAGAAIDSDNILVMDDLESKWGGSFLIHVSSFRESDKARTEVSYLVDLDYPVFIVYIDLGVKGKWYRVYAGPFERREEARNAKKNLDDTPGVRFTRITQIPK